jgi:penicillin-binding protein 1A
VGFDSRESLGDKETGAKAALPIWMTVMRQAIAGKENERFLGEVDNPMVKAAAETPAKAGTASAAGKPPTQPAAKPPVQPAAGSKPMAKPASTSPPVAGTAKAAASSGSTPAKPKDQR